MATSTALTAAQVTQVNALIKQQAAKIAQQVYDQQGTKYGVSVTPLHRHNGADSPQIGDASITNFSSLPATSGGVANPAVLNSETISNPSQASNINLASIYNAPNVFVMPIPVIYGEGNNLFSVSAWTGGSSGKTSNTLTISWPYPSGIYSTLFTDTSGGSHFRLVSYGNASNSISWVDALPANITTSIQVYGAPFNFVGGTAPIGSLVLFTNPQDAEANYVQFWACLNTTPNVPDQTLQLTTTVTVEANSATLLVDWGYATAKYAVTFSTGDKRLVQFTQGSTSIAWIDGVGQGATNFISVSATEWWGNVLDLSPLEPDSL